MIQNNPHYPYITRSVINLFNAGALTNVESIFIEPDYGYFVQLNYTNGARRMTYGNDLGLNTGSAEEIAKDKGYTKKLLRHYQINCPAGQEFILPWWNDTITLTPATQNVVANSSNLSNLTKVIIDYISESQLFPVYIKPIAGSKGAHIYRATTPDQVTLALSDYEQNRIRLAVVEKEIPYPDYRIVVLDGQLISAYKCTPLSVTGDGHSTIHELLVAKQKQWQLQGRDTKLAKILPKVQYELGLFNRTLEYVPAESVEFTLLPVSNLSLGGESVDVTKQIHPHWVQLACTIAGILDLRLAGIDLACQDITSPTAEYSVLEVNASPGLDHYATSGEQQEQTVQALYAKVLNTP